MLADGRLRDAKMKKASTHSSKKKMSENSGDGNASGKGTNDTRQSNQAPTDRNDSGERTGQKKERKKRVKNKSRVDKADKLADAKENSEYETDKDTDDELEATVTDSDANWAEKRVRGDKMTWLHDDDLPPNSLLRCKALQTLYDIRDALNMSTDFACNQTQVQLACYPGNGARYRRYGLWLFLFSF